MQRPFVGGQKAHIVCTYMYSPPLPSLSPSIDEKRNRKSTVLSTHCVRRVCVSVYIYVLIFVRILI